MKNCFIIVNYNDYKTVIELIDNIKDYNVVDEIVIVDNNSSDESYSVLKKLKSKKIVLIKSDLNKGYGSGINIGIKYLEKKYTKCNIIVSNPDIQIENEEVLKNMLRKMKQKEIAILSPVIMEKGNLNRGWKIPTPTLDALMNLPILHKIVNKKLLMYKDVHYLKETSEVEVVSGSFFIIKLDVIKKVDYFDENVFLYYEENILAHKLREFGYKTYIDNTSSVVHNHSVSINKSIKRLNKFKILKKSQMYFEYKYNKPNIFEKILLKITYYISLFLQELIYVIESK